MSDANRRASMPNPTAEKPTTRPGQGGFYAPPAAKRTMPPTSHGNASARGANATTSNPI